MSLRNRMKFRVMLKALKKSVGTYMAGMFIAVILDGLDEFMQGIPEKELRTFEVTFNNFYSKKFNVATGKYE